MELIINSLGLHDHNDNLDTPILNLKDIIHNFIGPAFEQIAESFIRSVFGLAYDLHLKETELKKVSDAMDEYIFKNVHRLVEEINVYIENVLKLEAVMTGMHSAKESSLFV